MKLFRKTLSLVFCLAIVLSCCSFSFADTASKGISTFEELSKISENLEGNYHLKNDIDAAGKELKPIGDNLNKFTGTFDGKGYTISGLKIGSVVSDDKEIANAGIFANNYGTIKNLNIENAEVNGGSAKYTYTGIIAAKNQGTISNCYVSGKVISTKASSVSRAGALVGKALAGEIKNCVSYANIYNTCETCYSGGLVGEMEAVKVSNCAVYGSIFSNGINGVYDSVSGGIAAIARKNSEIENCLVSGGNLVEKACNVYIGGIAGKLSCKVQNVVVSGSLAFSQATAHRYLGAIGGDDGKATVNNAYFLNGIIAGETSGLTGTNLSKDEFKDSANFKGLDFSSVWSMEDGIIKLNNLPKPSSKDNISKLVGIKIVSEPKKLKYVQGKDSTLNFAGLQVNAVYSDKEVKLENNEFSVSGFDFTKTGKQTIKVLYKGFTDTFKIELVLPETIIVDKVEITDGSYTEGNPDGGKSEVEEDKKEESDKPSSEKEETIENDDDTVETKPSVSVGLSEGDWEEEPEETEENKPKVWVYVLISVIGLIVLAVVVIFIVLSFKQKGKNEISNDDIVETEKDENDIY